MVAPTLLAADEPPSSIRPARIAADPVRTYAPGVRIDWARRVVELDARVVLREGLLELFSCSPQTREHESIFVVPAQPRRIYEALGLIGLEPGKPVRYDAERDQSLPATGDALRVTVRFARDGIEWTIPAHELVIDRASDTPPTSLDWVFAGSRGHGRESFGADSDGTVMCLVDFNTALIAVASSHSADNELLWLAARSDAIPPMGTNCAIVVGPASTGHELIELTVAPGGELRIGGTAILPAKIIERTRSARSAAQPTTLVLRPARDVSVEDIKAALAALVLEGVDRRAIEVRPAAVPQKVKRSKASRSGG